MGRHTCPQECGHGAQGSTTQARPSNRGQGPREEGGTKRDLSHGCPMTTMISVCNLLLKVCRPMACRPNSLSQNGQDICKQVTPSLATCMQHTSSGKHSRCFILVLAHKMRALIRPLSLVGQSQRAGRVDIVRKGVSTSTPLRPGPQGFDPWLIISS